MLLKHGAAKRRNNRYVYVLYAFRISFVYPETSCAGPEALVTLLALLVNVYSLLIPGTTFPGYLSCVLSFGPDMVCSEDLLWCRGICLLFILVFSSQVIIAITYCSPRYLSVLMEQSQVSAQ